MRSRRDARDDQPAADPTSERRGELDEPRHSDVVPRGAGSRDPGDLLLGGPSHLSWPELRSLRVPDERRGAWMTAYEASFDHAFEHCPRADWLVPLV